MKSIFSFIKSSFIASLNLCRRVRQKVQTLLAIGICILFLAPGTIYAKNYTFGVMGDTAYFPGNESLLDNMITEIDSESLGVIVHVGDIQAFQSCSDNTFNQILNQFNASKTPLVYTPGDNDWTDCWGVPEHPIPPLRNPLDALASLRMKFFPTISDNNNSQGASLGTKPIPLIRQSKQGDDPNTSFDESKFVENQMWVRSGIVFATFHMVGSNDNCVQRAIGGAVVDGNLNNVPDSCSAEKRERTAANIAWLKQAFAKAKAEDAKGVALFTQVVMDWAVIRDDGSCIPIGELRHDGVIMTFARFNLCKRYEEFQINLGQQAQEFKKPVALVWGDAHFFRYFKPIRAATNLVGVQTTGSANFGWVHATVDNQDPKLFRFSVGSCISGPAPNAGLPARSYCQDSYRIKVLTPAANSGNFEGFELALIDPSNGNNSSGVSVNSLPNETFNGEVAYVGRGCPDPDGTGPGIADTYLANPSGKIALIDRGGCREDNKVAWAEKNGAIGAIIANDQDASLFTIFPGGNSPITIGSPAVIGWNINIPAFGVYKSVAEKNLKSTSGPVTINVTGVSTRLNELTNLHGVNN